MKAQLVQDHNGKLAGIFITYNEWELIKSEYPDIDKIDDELPQWQKDIIDGRLKIIAENSEVLRPIDELF